MLENTEQMAKHSSVEIDTSS